MKHVLDLLCVETTTRSQIQLRDSKETEMSGKKCRFSLVVNNSSNTVVGLKVCHTLKRVIGINKGFYMNALVFKFFGKG